jgi:hypothetical protein
MAQVTRAASKAKFETADEPSAADFIDLHDSVFFPAEDALPVKNAAPNKMQWMKLGGFPGIFEPINVNFSDASTTHTTVDGSCRCILAYLPEAATLTGIKYFLTNTPSFTADNNNKFGIYTINTSTLLATLAASSTNDGTHFTGSSNTVKTIPFTSTYAASAGWYLISYLWNSSATSTAPQMAGAAQAEIGNNGDWFANGLAFAYSVTGQTDMPATIDLTSVAKTNHRQYLLVY